jgi:DNA polymerase elongation subunit (family B)
LVQKVLLNSLYGVLGLPVFRFFDIDNAEAVTITGQSVILNTAKMANIKYNEDLGTDGIDYNIYVDTDSIYFSAAPILEKKHPEYKSWDVDKIANMVDDIAGEMQSYLNEFYDDYAKEFFNIDTHRFEIKKELISSSGIWIAKKMYAQWIVMENSVRVDELQVKGLAVVRSSFPTAFKNIMKDVIIAILLGKPKKEVDDIILSFRTEIKKWSPKEIAKSTSVKELSKYNYVNRKMSQFKTGTPAHIKAALSYNDLLKYFKCSYEHSPFGNGDKVKWVYLKDNPFNLDGIAFRGDNDPEEIMEYVTTYIDTNKIFKRELQSKLDSFYEALHWAPPTDNMALVTKFFEME